MSLSKPQIIEMFLKTYYNTLLEETYVYGLREEEIDRSKRELSEYNKERLVLKKEAYKPTGIVLGCPLPDKIYINQLWNISKSIEAFVKEINPKINACFAYVPRDYYHITLLNRTHFDHNREIKSINSEEKNKIQEILKAIQNKPISIHFKQLLLTSSGRLILAGYPDDEDIYVIREKIIEILPEFKINKPITAHIKLGHLLVLLKKDDLDTLLRKIKIKGNEIKKNITFTDLYTPLGRIPFN